MGINAYLKQFQLYKILMCPLCASPASPMNGKPILLMKFQILLKEVVFPKNNFPKREKSAYFMENYIPNINLRL